MEETETKETPTEEPTQSSKLVDDAVNAAESVRKATAQLKAENDRRAELDARNALGGVTDAGQQPPKEEEKISDVEYARALQKGLVDPLSDDGLIK